MATPDPIKLLQRVAANVGRSPSADLLAEVYAWVSSGAVPILNGTDPAEALGLKAQRGAWQTAPRHRVRFDRRNTALRELWRMARGTDPERACQVQEWATDWGIFTSDPLTPLQARLLLGTIPEAAREHLDVIADTGLRVPEKRAFQRVVRPVSQGTDSASACGSLQSKAPPIAAHGN